MTVLLQRNIHFAPGHQLIRIDAGSGHILASPQGRIQLNASAARVLALCDGTRTPEGVISRALLMCNLGPAEDIRAFLREARLRGWLIEG